MSSSKKSKSTKSKKSALKMKDLTPSKSPKGGAQKKEVGGNAVEGGPFSANGFHQ